MSGYVGSQTCLLFLKSGRYHVRGTVRNKTNEEKIAPLKKAFGDYFEMLELVEADLLDEDSMIKAIEGSTYVVHVASPFVVEKPKDEDELIKPAVNGTLSAMKACRATNAKRIVITSSVVAIAGCKEADRPENGIFTEENWTDIENSESAYEKSKTLAEKAAWQYIEELPDDEKFEVVTINPALIVGPSLCGPGFTSQKIIADLVNGKYPGLPKITMGIVDVREVAEAHLKALEVEAAAN